MLFSFCLNCEVLIWEAVDFGAVELYYRIILREV